MQNVLDDMLSLKVLAAVHLPLDSAPASAVFRFIDGFMRDVIHSRLLVSQRQLLQQRINEAKAQVKELTQPTELLVHGQVKYSGFMHVRKALDDANVASTMRMRLGQWKKRWVVLHENSLSLYYQPTHPRVLGVIFLDGASVTTMPDTAVGREYTMQIEAQFWMKKGTFYNEKRLYYFSAGSLEEARVWSYKISMMIEKQLSVRERHAIKQSLSTAADAALNQEKALWTREFYSRSQVWASDLMASPTLNSTPLQTPLAANNALTLQDESRTAASPSLPLTTTTSNWAPTASSNMLSVDPSPAMTTTEAPPRRSRRSYFQRLRRRTNSELSPDKQQQKEQKEKGKEATTTTTPTTTPRRMKTPQQLKAKLGATMHRSNNSGSFSMMSGGSPSRRQSDSMSLNSSINSEYQQHSMWTPMVPIEDQNALYQALLTAWLVHGLSFVSPDKSYSTGPMRPLVAANVAIKHGWMYVRSMGSAKWNQRWVVLTPDSLAIRSVVSNDDVAVC